MHLVAIKPGRSAIAAASEMRAMDAGHILLMGIEAPWWSGISEGTVTACTKAIAPPVMIGREKPHSSKSPRQRCPYLEDL
jgi:hypothetical protein